MRSIYFPTKDTDQIIDLTVDISVLSSATMSNPQGDPNAGNMSRQTSDGFGYFTPAGFKFKLRSRYEEALLDQAGQPHRIWIKKGAVLSEGVEEACKSIGIDVHALAGDENENKDVDTPLADENEGETEAAQPETKGKVKKAPKGKKPSKKPIDRETKNRVIQALAKLFVDFKMFGGVLTKPFNVGVRGAIQIGMSFSVDLVQAIDIKITRGCVASAEEAASKEVTMGNMHVIRFGLYRTDIAISPFVAERVGLTWGDLDQFLDACKFIWSHSRAGARQGMAFERLDVFLHDKKGGSVPSEAIARALKVTRNTSELPTSINDYEIEVAPLPGVTHTSYSLLDYEEEVQAKAAE
jgi:Cas7 group CRISPR-associated protein Csh2